MTESFDRTKIPSGIGSEEPVEGRIERFRTPSNWPLFFHTAKNMQGRQLTGIVERKLRHAAIPRLPVDFDAWYRGRIPTQLSPETERIGRNLRTLRESLSDAERDRFRRAASEAADGRFTFIGRTIAFGDEIDWEHEKLEKYPLLWRLKLQSFEHFEWLVLGDEYSSTAKEARSTFEPQLHSWLAENPIGAEKYLRRSWIPHSVSLRILNWCRYAAWCEHGGESAPDELYRAIYKNALFLENHVEYEIGGNHLVENAVALIMAGVLFEAHDTEWIETGVDVLQRVGETQFLADGGHFERSPMYHAMVLRRYATAYDLLSGTPFSDRIPKETAERALGFLSEISKPDAEIPLLNDSVRGEQLRASTCIEYCESCSLDSKAVELRRPDGSGYRRMRSEGATLLIDVGEVGPPHLPAHSHNDHLSVLLWVDGEPVLTDTGVYDYGANERRQYSRSVEAHNTVQYADAEPIPIGGSYLMGKRTSVEVLESTPETIEARYERDTLVGPTYEHRRKVTESRGGFRVVDDVQSDSVDEITIRYHFHPSVDVRRDGSDDEFVASTGEKDVLRLSFSGVTDCEVIRTPYFERFGRERPRSTVEAESVTGPEVTTVLDWHC